MTRMLLKITGQVQGVFFRRSAKLEAENLGLVGWVKNLDDGSVQIMVQGEQAKVNKFVTWCKKGPPFAKVEKVHIDMQEGLERFEDFSIHD